MTESTAGKLDPDGEAPWDGAEWGGQRQGWWVSERTSVVRVRAPRRTKTKNGTVVPHRHPSCNRNGFFLEGFFFLPNQRHVCAAHCCGSRGGGSGCECTFCQTIEHHGESLHHFKNFNSRKLSRLWGYQLCLGSNNEFRGCKIRYTWWRSHNEKHTSRTICYSSILFGSSIPRACTQGLALATFLWWGWSGQCAPANSSL